MLRRFQGLLAALMALLLLYGCKAEPQNEKSLSGQTLTVVTPFGQGDGYQAVYHQLLTEFQDATGCEILDHSERSSEKWKLDVLSAFDDGSEPDVLFFFSGADADVLVKNGRVVDLDTIRQYAPNYAVHISSSVLNTMKAEDGLNYCVPVTGFWEGLYINDDLFVDNGIEVPTNMDELFSAVAAFNKIGIIPISVNLQSTPHYWFEYLLYNYTGPSSHNTYLNDAELREGMSDALGVIKQLYEAGAFPDDIESVTDTACTALFVDKSAAMMLDGSWAAGSIEDKENVHVVHMPAIKGGARTETDIIGGFSMGYYITKKAWDEKKDTALAFVEAMTNEAALALFNANGSASPGPRQNAPNTTEFVRSTQDFISSSTAFVPALQDGFAPEARDYLFSNVLAVAQGKLNVDEVLDEFFKLNVNSAMNQS